MCLPEVRSHYPQEEGPLFINPQTQNIYRDLAVEKVFLRLFRWSLSYTYRRPCNLHELNLAHQHITAHLNDNPAQIRLTNAALPPDFQDVT